jgi:hypothetical protein
MKTLMAAIAILLATATPSLAGFTNVDTANCNKDATGAGYCYGTMRGFKADPNPNSRASFYLNHQGAVIFSSYLGDKYFSCVFPTNAQTTAFASVAGQTNGFFVVNFDRNGVCTYGYAYSGSDYGSSY